MSKLIAVESELRALVVELAAAYRAVETLEQVQAWGEKALDILQVFRVPTSLKSNNTTYWLMQARRAAYFRTVQNWEHERDDGAGVFAALAQLKVELRRNDAKGRG